MLGKRSRGADRATVQNAAKTLAANIRFASVDNPVSSIVVTSSVPNEGKTFVAVELAQALASSGGKRVLLMECDMRQRSLAARLGAHGRHGIYDVLSGEADVDEAVVPTSTDKLYFLDAEPNIPNPTDIVSSKRFRGLLQAVRREFGYVVMDTPPLGAFVDAAVLSSVADATVLVAREDFVRRDDLLASFTQLKQAGANVVGTVLNCCDQDSGRYGYGYYGYYGQDRQEAVEGERDAGPRARAAEGPSLERADPSDGPHLRPIPEGRGAPPDSTAQFMAGYRPRTYTDE